MAEADRQRIDKWLWFVRLAKTRTAAQRLVEDGRVRVNREKVEAASRLVRPGDVLTVRLERQIRVLKVVAPGVRRGPPAEAQTLYEDLTEPADPSAPSSGGQRPTKRDRRALDAFHAGTPFAETDFSRDGDE